MTIREFGQGLRARAFSAHEWMQQTIAAMKNREQYRSFITTTFDEALAVAAERDRELAAGQDRGPLHGLPIAHKDNFHTKGVRTTAGSLLYREFVPDADAEAVKQLSDAGAISVGKTNMHELAFGITSKNPHYGHVVNPRDASRIAGGSSGGSAALVAAGLIAAATGTDTGGSLRIPGSYCGVVGMKPTYGRVSRVGVVPLSFSLDTVGPLGGCVDDCALLLGALTGGGMTAGVADWKSVRVGVPRGGFFAGIDAEVATGVERAIEDMRRLGAQVSDVALPDLHEMNAVARMVQLAETAALYAGCRDATQFGADVWALVEQGRLIAAHEYVNAQRLRTWLRRQMDALWREVDLLVTPTTPVVAPAAASDTVMVNGASEDIRLASTRLVRCFNLLGEPALSMPCGKAREGLPIGLQLIAAPGQDEELLTLAISLEREWALVGGGTV